jgi:RNA polymerase sigma-70 factor (ECF subfamily)
MSTDVTTLLVAMRDGDDRAADDLLPHVYDQLREIADGLLRHERADHTLQPTALVHEAYLRLIDQRNVSDADRTRFKAIAAKAMQRILIDHARGRQRIKRGRGWRKIGFDDAIASEGSSGFDVVEVHDALERMREVDERQAEIMRLRLLGGLSMEETALLLDCSTRTIERDWKMGRAWLRRALIDGREETES